MVTDERLQELATSIYGDVSPGEQSIEDIAAQVYSQPTKTTKPTRQDIRNLQNQILTKQNKTPLPEIKPEEQQAASAVTGDDPLLTQYNETLNTMDDEDRSDFFKQSIAKGWRTTKEKYRQAKKYVDRTRELLAEGKFDDKLIEIAKKTKGAVKQGWDESQIRALKDKARLGEVSIEEVKKVIKEYNETNVPIESQQGLVDTIYRTGEIVGGMAEAATSEESLAGLAAGTAIGPYVGPGGVVSGVAVGSMTGQYLAWQKRESGDNFWSMIEADVDPQIARYVSPVVGSINAAIEMIQIAGLLRGSPAIFKKQLRKTAVKNVGDAVKKTGLKYGALVGSETLEEIAQYTISETGKLVAMYIDQNVKNPDMKDYAKQMFKGMMQTASQTIGPMGILGAPSAVLGGAKAISEIRKPEIATKPIVEAKPEVKTELTGIAEEGVPTQKVERPQVAEVVTEPVIDLQQEQEIKAELSEDQTIEDVAHEVYGTVPETKIEAGKVAIEDPELAEFAAKEAEFTKIDIPEEDKGKPELMHGGFGVVDPFAKKPKEEVLQHYKYDPPSESWMADYKEGILEEIKDKKLPELTTELDWTPPTWGNQNPYTKTMKNLLSNVTAKLAETKTFKGIHPLDGRSKEALNLLRSKMNVASGLYNDAKMNFVDPLKEMTLPAKQELGLMIYKYMEIPEKYRTTVKNIDKGIAQFSLGIGKFDEEWTSKGWIRPGTSYLANEVALENLGSYARTLYVKDKEGKVFTKPYAGKSPSEIKMSMFKRKLVLDEDWGKNALFFAGKDADYINSLSKKELSQIGLDAKAAYGFVTQADVILDKTYKDLATNYSTMSYLDTIRKSPTLFSETAKEGWVSVPSLLPKGNEYNPRLGPINEGYIHPGLVEDIKGIITETDKTMMSELLGMWKISKTALTPGSTFRNLWSGSFIQNDIADAPIWDPRNTPTYVGSVKQYLTKGDRFKFWNKQGLYGADYFNVEINEEILDQYVKRDDVQGIQNMITNKIKKVPKKIRDMTKYYGMIDHLSRTYLAEWATKKGATPAQAVRYANEYQLDYRIVPKFIDNLRKGKWKGAGVIAPFMSFMYLMTPRVMEAVITKPWKILKYPIIFSAVNQMSRTKLEISEEEEEAMKPEWMEGHWTILLPNLSNVGEPQWIDLNYILPFGGDWKTLFTDVEEFKNMIVGGGPVQSVVNTLNNYDPFMDREIYDEDDLTKVKAKKIGAYMSRGILPGVFTDIERIKKAQKGEQYGYPFRRERSKMQASARIFGVSIYSGGINEFWRKQDKYRDKIRNHKRKIKYLYTNPNISEKEKKKQVKEHLEMINLIAKKSQDLAKVVKGVQKFKPKGR